MRRRGRSPGGAGRSRGRPEIDPRRCNQPPPAGEGREAVCGDRHRKMQRQGVRLSAAFWREGGAAPAGHRFQLVCAAPCTAARRARDLTPASRNPPMLAVSNRTNSMRRNRVPSSGPRRAGSGPTAGCVRPLRGRVAWLEGRSFRCHRSEIACFPSTSSLQQPSTTLSGLGGQPRLADPLDRCPSGISRQSHSHGVTKSESLAGLRPAWLHANGPGDRTRLTASPPIRAMCRRNLVSIQFTRCNET